MPCELAGPFAGPGGPCDPLTAGASQRYHKDPQHRDKTESTGNTGAGAYAAMCAALTIKARRMVPRTQVRHDAVFPGAPQRRGWLMSESLIRVTVGWPGSWQAVWSGNRLDRSPATKATSGGRANRWAVT